MEEVIFFLYRYDYTKFDPIMLAPDSFWDEASIFFSQIAPQAFADPCRMHSKKNHKKRPYLPYFQEGKLKETCIL